MKNYNNYFLLFLFTIFISCLPNLDDLTSNIEETSKLTIENLSIPDGFNFETEREVTLSINDATAYVKYNVYAYSDNFGSEAENIPEALNNLLYSGKPFNGKVSQVFSLSSIYDKVYILRKDGLEYSSEIIEVLNNKIDIDVSFESKSSNTNAVSSSECAECTENFFLNGDFEDGSTLPSKYIITNESNVDGWSTTANDSKIELWKTGFESVLSQNGSYFAELNANKSAALYQRVCTSPGAEISWSVWHRGRAGTDIAVVRIGENLITATTEATMITGNTGWVEYSGTYTVPEGQLDTYFIFEAVSTASTISVGNFIDNVVITETVAGNCESANNKMFYPNELTNATIAFEDLWPYAGDYDFNDLVITYNIVTILNAENNVTQIDYNYTVQSIGASYTNGFGIELEGVLPSAISRVTGTNLTEGIIANNANGTEQAQPNAVIVFFDNSHINVGLSHTVTIMFSSPMSPAVLGTAPFNPFLIINKDRNKEIHLPNKPTTYYPTTIAIETSPTNEDSDGDFKTSIGLPWAINVSGEYKAPKESVAITDAYNFFAAWAISGGKSYRAWYEDKNGYRNNNNISN